jgi:hypothetical protein
MDRGRSFSSDWVELGDRDDPRSLDPLLSFRLRAYPVIGITEITGDPIFGKAPALIFDPKERPLSVRTRLFERFLEARADDQLQTFAAQTGALGLCVHGLPTLHPWLRSLKDRGRHRVATGNPDFCSTWNRRESDGRPVVAESLAAWRAWSDSARAITATAAMLHSRRPPKQADLDFLRNPAPPFQAMFESEAATFTPAIDSGDWWRILGLWLNVWLTLSGVQLHVGLFRDGLRLELSGKASLLGYLASSLASAVTRRPGLAFCSGCGAPFFPKRRQMGRGSYCEACGSRAAWRDAKRRARALEREKQQ